MHNVRLIFRILTALSLSFSSLDAADKSLPASRRRVLIIPFDNVQNNKNFDWMSESISDNMRAEMEKVKRFDVMDVTLLKRVTANIDYTNLTAEDATQLARTLNCEAALIGRYFIARRAGKERIIIQTEGVDTISGKSVFTSSLTADAGGNLFTQVENLAGSAVAELGEKLPPFDPSSAKRSGKFERLLYRLDHPPQGFFDSFEISHFALVPEFDIDIYEYEVNTDLVGEARQREFTFEYFPWGKVFKPQVTTEGMSCTAKQACTIDKDRSVLTLSHEGKSYRVRFNHIEPPIQITNRTWVTMGYPMLKSLGSSNPSALQNDGLIPLQSLNGLFAAEMGYSPARFQLPWKIKWSGVVQGYYGRGEMFQTATDYLPKISMSFFSVGGGVRIDRPFYIRPWYAISPLIGIYGHYQRFYKSSFGDAIYGVAFVPEIGINQTFRIFRESRWRLLLSTVAGSFLYPQQGQNLSYFRAGLGVEYAL